MDINTKLRLIQEGYSIGEINSPDFSPFQVIEESSLLPDYITLNPDYIMEASMEIIHESSNGVVEQIGKLFKWIWDKVIQFFKFIKNKFLGPNEKNAELERKIDRINNVAKGLTTVNYEITVHSHVYDTVNADFVKDGMEKVYNVLDKHIQKIVEDQPNTSNIVSFSDSITHDQSKFLDTIFNEALGVPYNEDAIIEKVYGPKKKVIVWQHDLKSLTSKWHRLMDQQRASIYYVEKRIPDALTKYREVIERDIKKCLDQIEWLKKGNDTRAINDTQKLLNAHKRKINKIIEIYNYMLTASTMVLNAHKIVTFKLGDTVQKIFDDMEGKIELAKKEVDDI